MFDNFDLETLEFPLFCDTVKKSFVSLFSIEKISSFYPKTSVSEVLSFQNDLKAVYELFLGNTPPKLSNDNEFYLLYRKIRENEEPFLSLEPEEYIYLKAFIYYIKELKKYLIERKHLIERLQPYLEALQPNVELADLIDRTFEDDGTIKDNASSELLSIRKKIKEMKKRVQQILHETFNKPNSDKYIQEQVVVLRNGRYTIACKTNFSQYISGIIHDRSASGQTVYVEPTSCVPVNNELQNSLIAESEEVAKILTYILSLFKSDLPVLFETVKAYSELAFLIDINSFFFKYENTFPEFGDKIYLKDVHHPLLKINKGDDSVPLDLSLSADESLIVVTGPNTGGKTASLKSMGLNHIIAMCGLPVFAKRAQMVFYTDIKADIGDKQSLVMDLSTFSSHMTNIRDIISNLGKRPLLLFDELGTGTDPKEGAAISLSVLDYLKSKGADVMITTHFSELKTYAFERSDAKMYAVDFDYETFSPRYSLLEGVAGKSDPIIIAERLNFPSTVIKKAKEYIENFKSQSEMALEELNLLKAEVEHARKSLKIKEAEFELKESRLVEEQKELDKKLSKRELELLEDTYALLQKGKRLAEERLKSTPDNISEDLSKVEDKIKSLKSKQKPIKELKVGDTVYLEKYDKIGKILSLDANSANINLEGIKVTIKRQDLIGKKLVKEKEKKVKITSSHSMQAKRELVLVGKRVEEALDIIDKYIDESLLAGYDKVYIVHGRGTGQLRAAIHNFLKSTGRVKSYSTASNEEGGNAVTVVHF